MSLAGEILPFPWEVAYFLIGAFLGGVGLLLDTAMEGEHWSTPLGAAFMVTIMWPLFILALFLEPLGKRRIDQRIKRD